MTTHAASKLTMPVSDRDHIQGPEDAPVTLVEYGDFECPHCGHAYSIVEELRKQFGNRMRFVFRHFPLSQAHPHAEAAAEAAEAAGAQDRFWEMHHALFTHQNALDTQHLIQYASRVGIDVAKFTTDLTTRTYQPRVHEDFMSGARSGVNGTPTFFINDVRYDGAYDVSSLGEAIELAAHQTKKTIA